MVFYFTCIDPSYTVYMGKDKYENEKLIAHGWDEDIWFHVDKLSSAHVYLRLKDNETIDDIAQDVLIDCAQLTKHNSIEGNKLNNIVVVYTPWSNLKKTGDMNVGQVSFHNPKLVKRINIEKRENAIINRLNKTKREEDPDLAALKEKHLSQLRKLDREAVKQREKEEKALREQREKEKEAKSYKNLIQEENMSSNKKLDQDFTSFEDDFM